MAGRARAAQAAKNNPQLEDKSWQVWKKCQYCDGEFLVNGRDDHKVRTPRFLGLVICLRCDPRTFDITYQNRERWKFTPKGPKPEITNEVYYRTIIATWIVRRIAMGSSLEWCRLQAQKFWDDQGDPR